MSENKVIIVDIFKYKQISGGTYGSTLVIMIVGLGDEWSHDKDSLTTAQSLIGIIRERIVEQCAERKM